MRNEKTGQVILWGLGDYTDSYIGLLNDAKINCKCIIDSYSDTDHYLGLTVISPDEYKRKVEDFESIPVVIIARSRTGQSRFAHVLQHATNFLRLHRTRFLHPVKLSDFINVTFPDRIYISGFPGSGNVLLRAVVGEFLNSCAHTHTAATPVQSLMHELSLEHHEILLNTLDSLFIGSDLMVRHDSLTHTGKFVYSGARKDEFVRIFDIKTKHHLSEEICSRHDLFEPETVNEHRKLGYKILVPIRNPLDTIISNAFKYEHTTVYIDPDTIPDSSQSEFKTMLGHARIHDYKWFHDIAESIHGFYSNLFQVKDAFLVKYEDVISKPFDMLKHIAGFIGLDKVSEDTIMSIWRKTGFKPLSNKAHYFKPGSGKWEKYLDGKHLAILKELGFEDLMVEFGYDFPTSVLGEDNKSRPAPNHYIDLFLSLHDQIQHINFGKVISFPNRELICRRSGWGGPGLLTNRPEYNALFNKMETSAYLKNIFNCI